MLLVVKNLPANAGDKKYGFDPWVRKISCRRAWQPTPVFLPGEMPWTEEPGRLQPIESHRAGHDRSDLARTHSKSYEKKLCIFNINVKINQLKFTKLFLKIFLEFLVSVGYHIRFKLSTL